MTSIPSLPLLFAANRILPEDVGSALQLPLTILFALFLGVMISLLAVFVIMIWKQLKLDGGQFLLWSLAGSALLAPAIYFVFLSEPTGIYLLDFFRVNEQSRLGLEGHKVPPVIYVPIVAFIASFISGVLLGKWLRLKEMGWRFGLILGSCLAAAAIILFGEFKLGVDLQGGVILVYEVDEEQTARLTPPGEENAWNIGAVVEVLKRRLNPDGLKEIIIRPFGAKQIEIVVPEVDEAEIDELKKKITTGGALQFMIVADENETSDRLVIDRAKEQASSKSAPVKTDERVRDKDGETIIGYWKGVARETENNDLSPFRDEYVYAARLRDRATGDLIELTANERAMSESNPKDGLPRVLAARGIKSIEVLLRYDQAYDLRGEDLGPASEGRDEHLRPSINFQMKGGGISKMGQLTSKFLKRRLAIVFDNQLLSAPTIQSQITERGQITGDFPPEEIRFMVEILRSGSMPVVLYKEPISENRIGSILGLDTIIKGGRSIAISLIVVLLFTLVYYRFAGMIACLALILNITLTVAIMVMLQAPFTLPGLAGIVLTVGMSVDSNVLIFERIREELEKGSALRMALRNGFDRAMTTIIDSNLTTLLTALVLYAIGTDQVRGFGITLTLGILTSMFTAIFCARTIFEAGERLKTLKSLSMMKILGRTNVDWCKWFPVATVGSAVLITVGLVATVARGVGLFDIDLAGGTSATMILKEKMTDADVRAKLEHKFAGLADPGTSGRVDFTVYEISFAGEEEGTVYKVDSNIPTVEKLQKAIQEAFRKDDGSEGLRTYKLDVNNVKTIAATSTRPDEESTPPPGGRSPFETPPPSDTKDLNKEKTPPGAPPAAVEPEIPALTKESEKKAKQKSEPAANVPAADAKSEKEPTPCGIQDEKQEEEKAASSEPASPTTDVPKSAPPADSAKTQPAAAEEPAKAEPGKAPPIAPPVAEEPALERPDGTSSQSIGPFYETSADIRLPGNKISGQALKDRLEAAVERALSQKHPVGISRKDPATGKTWDGKETTPYEDWTVTIPLSQEPAQKVLNELKASLEKSPVWQSSNAIKGQVTADTQFKAITAILISFLGIVAYIWFRFQNLSWGIAAVVALVHDTLVMLGFIAMSYWLAGVLGFLQVEEFKISLTIVAAFLTLIGFSINDTIVIFDRIREVRGKSPDLTADMINESVNKTMSRTILTTGTVLMVVVVLYFAGGSGIHAFAFSMIVGAIAGTYSTVFIAAPLLLWLHKRPRPAGGKVVKSIITDKSAASAR